MLFRRFSKGTESRLYIVWRKYYHRLNQLSARIYWHKYITNIFSRKYAAIRILYLYRFTGRNPVPYLKIIFLAGRNNVAIYEFTY